MPNKPDFSEEFVKREFTGSEVSDLECQVPNWSRISENIVKLTVTDDCFMVQRGQDASLVYAVADNLYVVSTESLQSITFFNNLKAAAEWAIEDVTSLPLG